MAIYTAPVTAVLQQTHQTMIRTHVDDQHIKFDSIREYVNT